MISQLMIKIWPRAGKIIQSRCMQRPDQFVVGPGIADLEGVAERFTEEVDDVRLDQHPPGPGRRVQDGQRHPAEADRADLGLDPSAEQPDQRIGGDRGRRDDADQFTRCDLERQAGDARRADAQQFQPVTLGLDRPSERSVGRP